MNGLLLDVGQEGVYVLANEVLLDEKAVVTVSSLQYVEDASRYASM